MPDQFGSVPSIFGGFQQPGQSSPREAIGTVSDVMTLAGKSKLGDIYGSAVNPQTGEIDPKVLAKRAHEAGVLAPELIKNALDLASKGVMIDKQKLETQREAWGNIAQVALAHADDPDLTIDKLAGFIMDMVGNPKFGGQMGHDAAITALKQLYDPRTGKPRDKAAMHKWIGNIGNMAMSAREQSEMLPYGLDEDGNERSITRNGIMAVQAAQRAQRGAAPGEGPSPPAITTKLGPGGQAALLSPVESSIQLEQAGLQSNDRTAALQNLQNDFYTLRNKMSNKTASEAEINNFVRRLTGFGITMKPEEIAAAESADKLTNQIIASQGQAMHLTDQAQRTQLSATPRINMSYMGADALTKMALGNEDAIKTKWDAWAKAKETDRWTPQKFHEWSRTFNKDFNPRVFQFARMRGKNDQGLSNQRQGIIDSMETKEEKQKFLAQVEAYEKRGWIPKLQ